ncbi:MAG: tripartite tricarboxylate transporter substrate binding protein [Burkholderiales bacterium]|nr:tripartite tricarboxylate transporter substrate binding protein [Burkholderiales bacterium]
MNVFCRVLVALWCALLVVPAQAQGWPDKPVRIVIPFPPGGGADAAARLIAGQLTKVLGQTFIVDSRPGGNTTIAAGAVARAPADGYTLLMTGGSTMSLLPLISEKLPFDTATDFAPVGMVSRFPYLLAASSQFGAGTLAEVLARARGKPGEVAYASNGTGGITHLGMEWLAHEAGVRLLHVPYKGFAPAVTDVVGGRTPLVMADWAPIAGSVQSGALKVLGVTSARRSPLLPDMPTLAEQGFPGYDLEIWFGLYAPAGTPADVLARLGDTMRQWLAGAQAREAFARIGHEPAPTTPADVRARIAGERKSFAVIVKAANIKAE